MKDDVRGTCLALIMSRTSGPMAGRCPRPAALGWKLERGMLPAAELEVLHASIRGALVGATIPRRWLSSAPLRALLAEYQDVRRGNRGSRSRQRGARRGKGVRVARIDVRPPTTCDV
jgi:hypothetical protein